MASSEAAKKYALISETKDSITEEIVIIKAEKKILLSTVPLCGNFPSTDSCKGGGVL